MMMIVYLFNIRYLIERMPRSMKYSYHKNAALAKAFKKATDDGILYPWPISQMCSWERLSKPLLYLHLIIIQ